MTKTSDMPIWVFLAFSAIETRRAALLLIYASALFCLYAIPWAALAPESPWLGKVFLIDDWSWLAMMIPIVVWYSLSLRWVDKNEKWPAAG